MKNNNKYIKSAIFIAISIILLFAAKDNISDAYSVMGLTDDEYTKISLDYDNMYENIKNKTLLEEKLFDISNKTVNLNIITNIRQEQIITLLYEFMSNCSIDVSSIDFPEISVINNAETEGAEVMTENKINTTVVSISFTASYKDMLKFIDEIQEGKTAVSISSIRVVMIGNEEIYGTIELVFYSLKINENYE